MAQNKELPNNEEVNMDDDLKEIIINSYKELKKDIRAAKTESMIIKNELTLTKWLLGILITVFGIITPIMFNLHSEKIDAKFQTINTKYENIINEIRNNKDLNQLQIERDVIREVSKYKK